MFFPSGNLKIFVSHTPTDMRKSFYGLCGIARELMNKDPLSGGIFVFVNKRKDMIKILWYENDGFAIWMKRKDKGCYKINFSEEPNVTPLNISELSILLKRN